MQCKFLPYCILSLSLLSFSAVAEDTLPALPPPPMPAEMEALEPEVTIVPRGSEMVKEYRINGLLYMIEIIPTKGVPYFLVDSDGDGTLESRRGTLDEGLLIPSWTLLRWK